MNMTIWNYLKTQKKTLVVMILLCLIPVIFTLLPANLYIKTEGKITQLASAEDYQEDLEAGHITSVSYDTGAGSFVYVDHQGNPYYVMERFNPSDVKNTTIKVNSLGISTAIWMAVLLLELLFIYMIGMFVTKQKSGPTHTTIISNPAQSQGGTAPKQGAVKTAETPVVHQKNGSKIVVDHITFDDVAGYQQTKESLQFLVTCLQQQSKLEKIGSKMPHGVLLYGPPGTGKTLLAKAIACTANVPFIYASGSQFMEMYVGVGAKNVRSIYEQARKQAPCVVFIDEIDAVGSSRSDGENNSERKQTLDALLVEMDGINQNKGILTIAATNLLDDLDAALTRSGRFDRKIAVPLPNREDRLAILKVHARNKRLSSDVDLDEIASMTVGFSGADLENILNEAGIIALQRGGNMINRQDVEKATMQVATGGETKPNSDENAKRLVAYHEAGHAIAYKLIAKEPVMRVTIMGSTSGVGGVTFGGHEDGKSFPSRKDLEHKIQVLYAGRVAEVLRFGGDNMTVGASNDIERATKLIRQYIINYGMSDEVGLLNMDVLMNTKVNMVPDEKVLEKARALSQKLYQDTLSVIKAHQSLLDKMANALLAKESLNGEEVDELVERHLISLQEKQNKAS